MDAAARQWPDPVDSAAAAEVFLAMCTHALTTEAEEVMGLLLGDIRVGPIQHLNSSVLVAGLTCSQLEHCQSLFVAQTGPGDTLVAYIRRAIPQIRTDRRKVRAAPAVALLGQAVLNASVSGVPGHRQGSSWR
jgi:hypothetical protein